RVDPSNITEPTPSSSPTSTRARSVTWSRWTTTGTVADRAIARVASVIGSARPWYFTAFSEICSTTGAFARSAPATRASACSMLMTLKAPTPMPSRSASCSRSVSRVVVIVLLGDGASGTSGCGGRRCGRPGLPLTAAHHGGDGGTGVEDDQIGPGTGDDPADMVQRVDPGGGGTGQVDSIADRQSGELHDIAYRRRQGEGRSGDRPEAAVVVEEAGLPVDDADPQRAERVLTVGETGSRHRIGDQHGPVRSSGLDRHRNHLGGQVEPVTDQLHGHPGIGEQHRYRTGRPVVDGVHGVEQVGGHGCAVVQGGLRVV